MRKVGFGHTLKIESFRAVQIESHRQPVAHFPRSQLSVPTRGRQGGDSTSEKSAPVAGKVVGQHGPGGVVIAGFGAKSPFGAVLATHKVVSMVALTH